MWYTFTMFRTIFNESAVLTDSVIDQWATLSENVYHQVAGKRAQKSAKVRLSVEEVLLRFRDLFGDKEECRLRCVRGFGGLRFEVSQKGAQQDPLNLDIETDVSYDILFHLNLKPRYAYVNGANVVTIPAPMNPRKNAMLIGVLTGAALAVLTWLLSMVLPDSVVKGYLFPLIHHCFAKLSSVFSALATPLVFFAVVSGIYGMGGVSAFGKTGGRLLRRMLGTYMIAMAAMVSIGICMGLLTLGASMKSGANVFSDLLHLVLDIVPDNLVAPFQIDNDLQVIVIAIFVGVMMLILGDRIRGVRSFCDELGTLVNQMMAVVCKTLPLFVYLGFSNMFLGNAMAQVSKVSRVFVISLIGAVITICITIVRTLMVTRIPFSKLLSAQLPSLIINLTTSSQVSAMPESMKCCKEKWGMDGKFTDFSLPLGIVVYMPNGAIMLGSIVWVLTDMSLGAVDLVMLIRIALVAVIVAIAAPPIPGSAFAVMPIMFSVCGTDLSMMPLAVIVGSTVGYLLPAMNGYCLQLELLMTAWKSNMVDKEAFKRIESAS